VRLSGLKWGKLPFLPEKLGLSSPDTNDQVSSVDLFTGVIQILYSTKPKSKSEILRALGGHNDESDNLNASSELTVAAALLGFAPQILALRLL
jgi:hypothetical protein